MKYTVIEIVRSTEYTAPDGKVVSGKIVDLEDETGKSHANVTVWGYPVEKDKSYNGELVPSGKGMKFKIDRGPRSGMSPQDKMKMDRYRGYGASFGGSQARATELLHIRTLIQGGTAKWDEAEINDFLTRWEDRMIQRAADFDKKIRAKLQIGD